MSTFKGEIILRFEPDGIAWYVPVTDTDGTLICWLVPPRARKWFTDNRAARRAAVAACDKLGFKLHEFERIGV